MEMDAKIKELEALGRKELLGEEKQSSGCGWNTGIAPLHRNKSINTILSGRFSTRIPTSSRQFFTRMTFMMNGKLR